MKKLFFIILLIICNSFLISAQSDYTTKDDSTKQIKTKNSKNWLFGELGGNGGAISVNYERYFFKNISFRIGMGTAIIRVAGAFPVMINYSHNNIIEFGIGLVPFIGAATGDWRIRFLNGKESGLLLTAVFGLKKLNNGFLFKLSLTPFFNPDGSKWGLTGGISFGFDL